MRRITGKKMDKKKAASANTMGRFETEMLSVQGNLKALSEVNGRWVERALEKTTHRRIILDMDSSASPVHGEQEASAYNGHFRCTCRRRRYRCKECGRTFCFTLRANIGETLLLS